MNGPLACLVTQIQQIDMENALDIIIKVCSALRVQYFMIALLSSLISLASENELFIK